jgi:Protein of unknown function (DUF1622)
MSQELVRFLALLCTTGGLISGLIVLVTVRRPVVALQVAIDFWVAAGLLRLTGRPSWEAVVGAAGILIVRQVITFTLRHSPRGAGGQATTARRSPN